MSPPAIERARAELSAIRAEYASRFAGRDRVTRSLGELDAIVARADALAAEIEGMLAGSEEARALLDTTNEVRAAYRAEREAIDREKHAEPAIEERAHPDIRAELALRRYERHFLGQARATRDLGLLDELISDVDRARKAQGEIAARAPSPGLEAERRRTAGLFDLLRSERATIEAAQRRGSPADRAEAMSAIANGQFATYRAHFSKRPRITRRPQLLVRMAKTLRSAAAEMRRVHAELGGAEKVGNAANIDVVTANLEMYERELADVRRTRQAASLVELMSALGEEANEVFRDYQERFAGEERAVVDEAELGLICDRLGEVLRQMEDLDRTTPSADNRRNISIVLDQLLSFEAELAEIREARRAIS